MYSNISNLKNQKTKPKKNNAPLHSFLLINRHRIIVALPRQMITMIVHRRHRRVWAHHRPVIINVAAPVEAAAELAAVVVAVVQARIDHATMILGASDISATHLWVHQSGRCCAVLPAPVIYLVHVAQCPYAVA